MTAPPIRDNAADRAIGAHWEGEFCRMARTCGKFFTPHQFNRPNASAVFYGPADLGRKAGWTLPDITVWSAPGEHHEIKHKAPTYDGMYGLERYRLDALVRFAHVTQQAVYYTIHDWQLAGATSAAEEVENDPRHWVAADVMVLAQGFTRRKDNDWTWCNGRMQQMEVWYWHADPTRKVVRRFRPLTEIWTET